MTVLIQCDNADCGKTFTDEVQHIAIKVEIDGEEVHELLELTMPGWFPHTHFCSMACLASWAMGQHLEEAEL